MTQPANDHEREVYHAIGEFVVVFSQMQFTLEYCIGRMVRLDPVNSEVVIAALDFQRAARDSKDIGAAKK